MTEPTDLGEDELHPMAGLPARTKFGGDAVIDCLPGRLCRRAPWRIVMTIAIVVVSGNAFTDDLKMVGRTITSPRPTA
jgi:hypothetical protein